MRIYRRALTAALISLAACKGATSPYGCAGNCGSQVGNVTVGNVFFKSVHNGSQNPAVDTVALLDTVTWVWGAAGSHGIQSTGTPLVFKNSVVMSAANSSYAVVFKTAGTYTYQCAVHGSAMTGIVVVR